MKLNIPSFLVLLLFSQTIASQNKKVIDSLEHLLSTHKTEDSIRVGILTELHENLMFSEPLKAKKYATEELNISKKINYQFGIAKGFMHLGDFYMNRNSTDSALYHYNKAKQVFIDINKARGIVFVNYSIAGLEKTAGNFEMAIKFVRENLTLIDKHEKNPIAISKFSAAQYNLLANIYMEKGDYTIAVTEALKALDLFTEIKDEVRKADVLKLLGDLEYALDNYEKSINYYNKSIKTYTEYNDEFYLAHAKSAAGLALKELGEYEKAKEYQLQAIKLARNNQAKMQLSEALISLGELLILEENNKKAKELFTEAKKIAETEDAKIPLIKANEGLAKATMENPVESIKYVNQAITIGKKMKAMSNLQKSYALRSKINQHNNKNRQALSDLKMAQKINDSLFNLKKTQQVEELKTIYETEKKEAALALQEEEIKTLNEKSRADNLQKGLYAGGMASALALFGLSVFGYRQRIKRNRITREKQEEILKQEIAHKQKELASQTLHLVQKNTFIQELKENLENLKNSPEKFKAEFRRIVMLLKKENASDKDWETFKNYFSEVHNNFDQKLKTLYADISEKEIRLAAFLRMNLTTKEIAATMNVLPDSILKSKYRLKKKLNLDKETDLTGFLNNL
ncbi:MAG: tetratricopeptide repeat protein [Bacteroidota bacterium]